MKIGIRELRIIIREEIERNLRWTAGSFMGNLSAPSKGVTYMPLPGLGSSTERNTEDVINTGEYEEEKEESRDDDTD